MIFTVGEDRYWAAARAAARPRQKRETWLVEIFPFSTQNPGSAISAIARIRVGGTQQREEAERKAVHQLIADRVWAPIGELDPLSPS